MNNDLQQLISAKGRTQLPNILLAAAECAPLSKTGGLADVVGTLPKALAKLGIDARVITPYHRIIKEKYADRTEHMFDFYCTMGWRQAYVGVEKLVLDGVTVYLIDNEQYFGNKIYLGGWDEGEQYSYFCRAVMDAIPNLDFIPDVVHCNDWHTAMLPMLAKTQYMGCMQNRLRFVLTIHNIAFQGRYGFDFVRDLLGIAEEYCNDNYLELFGAANYMKAGCVFTDWINTVSPSYAQEIMTAYYGEGLDGVLSFRKERLSGIVNGIDTDVYNPATDPIIAANFSVADRSGKAECKKAIQRELGLDSRPNAPLFAMVTRMTGQKGFDLVVEKLDALMASSDMQFILLGSGEAAFEESMRQLESRWKGRLCAYIGYNESLAHRVYAGADFYLMPSRFEPCGLSQMIAMRYGTVPIVRETGGLRDTVMPYNQFTGEGTGFSFANYSADEMEECIKQAIACYYRPEVMQGLIRSDLESDFSFDISAMEYARVYIGVLDEARKKPVRRRKTSK